MTKLNTIPLDMRPESIYAILIKEHFQTKGEDITTLSLSKFIYDLKQKGYQVYVDLRSIPGGYFSEDISSFIQRFLLFGYANDVCAERGASRIIFNETGQRILEELIEEGKQASPESFDRLVKGISKIKVTPKPGTLPFTKYRTTANL